jgi:hypothetical protein
MSSSTQPMPFGEILEAVGRLTPEEQADLLDIIRRRLADVGRKRLIRDVAEARREFADGGCSPKTADELMNEILS